MNRCKFFFARDFTGLIVRWNLRSGDTGTECRPTILAGAPGERPVLSGGVKSPAGKNRRENSPGCRKPRAEMSGSPTRRNSAETILDFRQLWVNGQKAVRAREPDGENLARLVAWDKTNQVATIPAAALAGVKHPARLEMVIDQVWEIAVLRVKSIRIRGANALLTFQQPEGKIEFQHPWPPVIVKTNYHAPFFLANAVEFLDTPGEWFEDLRAGKIYYWPRAGEDLTRRQSFRAGAGNARAN